MRMESTSPVRLGQGHAPVISIVVQIAGRLPHGRSAGRTLLAARLMARPQAGHRHPRLPIGLILLGQVAWVGLCAVPHGGIRRRPEPVRRAVCA